RRRQERAALQRLDLRWQGTRALDAMNSRPLPWSLAKPLKEPIAQHGRKLLVERGRESSPPGITVASALAARGFGAGDEQGCCSLKPPRSRGPGLPPRGFPGLRLAVGSVGRLTGSHRVSRADRTRFFRVGLSSGEEVEPDLRVVEPTGSGHRAAGFRW